MLLPQIRRRRSLLRLLVMLVPLDLLITLREAVRCRPFCLVMANQVRMRWLPGP